MGRSNCSFEEIEITDRDWAGDRRTQSVWMDALAGIDARIKRPPRVRSSPLPPTAFYLSAMAPSKSQVSPNDLMLVWGTSRSPWSRADRLGSRRNGE